MTHDTREIEEIVYRLRRIQSDVEVITNRIHALTHAFGISREVHRLADMAQCFRRNHEDLLSALDEAVKRLQLAGKINEMGIL